MDIRAVLFDVGGPIDTEVLHEQLVDAYLLRGLREVGVEPTAEEFDEASRWAVACFAPNTYLAMLWRLCGGDTARTEAALAVLTGSSVERRQRRGGLELRPGIAELLERLHGRGLKLGLAANQPAEVLNDLDRLGVGRFFSHRQVSGHHGYHKPDVRLFTAACEDLGVAPQECVMVGDRIDNDIFPANLLGMATVLYRTGRHIEQLPRSPREVPDEEVWTVDELDTALERLTARG